MTPTNNHDGKGDIFQSFNMEKWLSAYLLSLVSSSGIRKFTFSHPRESKSNSPSDDVEDHKDKEIWVFSTDLAYTSSFSEPFASAPLSVPSLSASTKPISALKVFYRTTVPNTSSTRHGLSEQSGDNAKNGESLAKGNLHTEELHLPLGLERVLWALLKHSNGILPDSSKVFGEWKVGLLGKFDAEDARGP